MHALSQRLLAESQDLSGSRRVSEQILPVTCSYLFLLRRAMRRICVLHQMPMFCSHGVAAYEVVLGAHFTNDGVG